MTVTATYPTPAKRLSMNDRIIAAFTIAGEPMSKARARVVNGHAYTPERTRVAEGQVIAAFLQAAPTHRPGAAIDHWYGVTATFFHQTRQRRDIDNMLKLILDGLNGYAWEDDVQVIEIACRKTLVPKGEARTEVTIYELDGDPGLEGTCEQCGKTFRSYPSLIDKTKFCSADCRNASRIHGAPKTCESCGGEFRSSHRQRFCSVACRHSGHRITQRCDHCGTPVERVRSWSTNGRPFCDVACRTAYWGEHRAVAARGVCSVCSGSTSKKTYTRCRACAIRGAA